MQLGLIITAHCNASCSHCSASCGPRRTEHLPRAKILSLMDEAVELAEGKPLEFLLSGGEPFLDFELLLEIVAYGSNLGAVVTCVTNGYWAKSAEKAREVLTAVKVAGLSALAVSTSRFHQPFVKVARVERVMNAAREVGLSCTLKYVRTGRDALDEQTIKAWALSAGASEVQDFALLPYLSEGQILPDEDYPRSPGLPEGPCPSPLLTVRENGDAFPCCTPGALVDLLALGSTHELSLRDLHKRRYLGGIHQLLREQGPIHFARKIQADGKQHLLRPAYADICDLCAHIVSDHVLAATAEQCSEALEKKQVNSIFEKLFNVEPEVELQQVQ